MAEGKGASARPVSSAFLICDRVITESGTNKKTLVGVFSLLWAAKFPTVHLNVALYYRGMLEEGEHDFRIDYGLRASDEVLSKVEGVLHVGDSKSPTEFAANLPFIRLPVAGEYDFRLWIDEAYVQRTGFTAGILEPSKEAGDADSGA